MNQKTCFSLILLLQFIGAIGFAQCDVAQIVATNKTVIVSSPYQYDGFLIHDVSFVENDKNNKQTHAEFIAFKKQLYKLVFCTSGFEEDVKITIYKKNKPKEILAEQVMNASVKQWLFEPLKPGVYDIVYTPTSSNFHTQQKGCIVMLIGFKK